MRPYRARTSSPAVPRAEAAAASGSPPAAVAGIVLGMGSRVVRTLSAESESRQERPSVTWYSRAA